MQTRWLAMMFAGVLSNEPECVVKDNTAGNYIIAAANMG